MRAGLPHPASLPGRTGGRVGRVLCRLRLHRWEYGTAVDRVDGAEEGITAFRVVTYAWCGRKGCAQPNRVVDDRTRTVNESRVGG